MHLNAHLGSNASLTHYAWNAPITAPAPAPVSAPEPAPANYML